MPFVRGQAARKGSNRLRLPIHLAAPAPIGLLQKVQPPLSVFQVPGHVDLPFQICIILPVELSPRMQDRDAWVFPRKKLLDDDKPLLLARPKVREGAMAGLLAARGSRLRRGRLP